MKKIANPSHLLLSLNLALLTLTLMEPLMFWVAMMVVASVVIRIALFLDWHKHLPKHTTINLLGLLAALVLAYTGWHKGLLLSMINLLVMSGALKLMLMRKVRDYFLMVLVELFIIGCGFIFNQTPVFTALYGAALMAIMLSLALHVSPSPPIYWQLRRVAIMALQALPICILLFLTLPKLPPLWKMPGNNNAKTGIAEQITPGDFARLSKSDALVFRATFDGPFPEKESLYWRTLVYEHFDGKTWRLSEHRRRNKERLVMGNRYFSPVVSGAALRYSILMEPSQQRWLYALDVPQPKTEGLWLSFDYQLQSYAPVANKFKYDVASYPDTLLNQAPLYLDQQLNLQLPVEHNPKTRQWVADMVARYPKPDAFIQAVEAFFIANRFTYTLNPSPMLVNPVDQFLFQSKAGFCSHYASAFAYIMRLAGIPARMVGGYQGGEIRDDNYISVHQYDAHAWVEIYVDHKGWERRDPTALISPNRISIGLESAVAYENSFLQDSPFSLSRLKSIAFLNKIRLLAADLDFAWSNWILGFDQKRQLVMFEALLGSLAPERIVMLSLSVIFIITLLLALYNHRIWLPRIADQHLHYYQIALRVLAKHGYRRENAEGPQSFATRLDTALPEQCAEDFRHITKLFIFHSYAPKSQTNPDRLPELKIAVRSFKRRYRFAIK